jgi:hypothetical protein
MVLVLWTCNHEICNCTVKSSLSPVSLTQSQKFDIQSQITSSFSFKVCRHSCKLHWPKWSSIDGEWHSISESVCIVKWHEFPSIMNNWDLRYLIFYYAGKNSLYLRYSAASRLRFTLELQADILAVHCDNLWPTVDLNTWHTRMVVEWHIRFSQKYISLVELMARHVNLLLPTSRPSHSAAHQILHPYIRS